MLWHAHNLLFANATEKIAEWEKIGDFSAIMPLEAKEKLWDSTVPKIQDVDDSDLEWQWISKTMRTYVMLYMTREIKKIDRKLNVPDEIRQQLPAITRNITNFIGKFLKLGPHSQVSVFSSILSKLKTNVNTNGKLTANKRSTKLDLLQRQYDELMGSGIKNKFNRDDFMKDCYVQYLIRAYVILIRNVNKDRSHRINKDFNFSVHYDVIEAIKCEQVNIDTIYESIKKGISEDELRRLFVFGLEYLFRSKNNFSCVANIHKQLLHKNILAIVDENRNKKNNSNNKNKNENENEDNLEVELDEEKGRQNAHEQVFDIENLMCEIFSYLDMKSFYRCNLVRKQWLRDSYRTSSVYHLNFGDFNKNNNYNGLTNTIDVDILRFRHVSSLSIYPNEIAQEYFGYWEYLTNFANVSHLTADGKSNPNISNVAHGYIVDLINRNHNNLNTLKMISYLPSPYGNNNNSNSQPLCLGMKSWTLPNLKYVYLDNVRLSDFYLGNMEMENSLETLIIENSTLYLSFWNDLANKKCDLSKLKTLTLTKNETLLDNKDDNENEAKINSDVIIPSIVSKLTNLEEFYESKSNIYQIFDTDFFVYLVKNNNKLRKLKCTVNISMIDRLNEEEINSGINYLEEATIELEMTDNGQENKDISHSQILARVLKLISMKKDKYTHHNNNDNDDDDEKNHICKIQLLEIGNLCVLSKLSTLEIRNVINSVEYINLREINLNGMKSDQEKCSIKQLINHLDLINQSSDVISMMPLNVTVWLKRNSMTDDETERIVDGLKQCYKKRYVNFGVKFQGYYHTQLKVGSYCMFPYDFSVMLINKIHKTSKRKIKLNVENKTDAWKQLDRDEFVGPLYGGSKQKIVNGVKLFNGRVCFNVLLHGSVDNGSDARFDFVVKIEGV